MRSRMRGRTAIVRFPWGLIGAALLVVLIEGFIAGHEDDRFLTLQSWTWRHAARDAANGSREAEILCLGDSLVQGGVAAPLLEAQLGLKTRVLAIAGGQAPSSYYLL